MQSVFLFAAACLHGGSNGVITILQVDIVRHSVWLAKQRRVVECVARHQLSVVGFAKGKQAVVGIESVGIQYLLFGIFWHQRQCKIGSFASVVANHGNVVCASGQCAGCQRVIAIGSIVCFEFKTCVFGNIYKGEMHIVVRFVAQTHLALFGECEFVEVVNEIVLENPSSRRVFLCNRQPMAFCAVGCAAVGQCYLLHFVAFAVIEIVSAAYGEFNTVARFGCQHIESVCDSR